MDDGFILPARHKLTVDEYYRMGEADIFGEDDRIELIDGDLIDMAPIGQVHEAIVNRLTEAFVWRAMAGRLCRHKIRSGLIDGVHHSPI